MSDASLIAGIQRTITTPAGMGYAAACTMLGIEALKRARALADYHHKARVIGVSDRRAQDLLEGEMLKARGRADFTSADALASAEAQLIRLEPEGPMDCEPLR